MKSIPLETDACTTIAIPFLIFNNPIYLHAHTYVFYWYANILTLCDYINRNTFLLLKFMTLFNSERIQ